VAAGGRALRRQARLPSSHGEPNQQRKGLSHDKENGRIFIGIGGWTFAPWRGVLKSAWRPLSGQIQRCWSRSSISLIINGTLRIWRRPLEGQSLREAVFSPH
jgi:hypothetical protein